MRTILIIILLALGACVAPKQCCAQDIIVEYLKDYNLKSALKKQLKFATVYGAVNGGTSVSDVKTFSVTSGQLQEG